MTSWTFRPPTVDEGPASWEDRLFLRVKLTRGITILEGPPGTYRAVRFPTQDEIAASAPGMYMGGHEYAVDDATKAALIAAGVGVTESNFTLIS
jgi:hypothetical protein